MKLAKHMLLQIPNIKLHKDRSVNFGDDTGEQTCLPVMHLCHAVCVTIQLHSQ
jgi:hypothetical protein